MARKILAAIIFVIVVLVLGMVMWALLANVIYVSTRSKSLLPVNPSAVSPIASLGISGNPPQIEAKDLGELSPAYGKINISKDNSYLRGDNSDDEYIYVIANIHNKEPIKLSGMILHSLVSNQMAMIPKGVETFVLGQVNIEKDIYLAPGEVAILHSGKSPAGVSFKSNMCSGFLNDLWENSSVRFSTAWCPRPELILPNTVSNIKKYGDSCMDAVQELSRCEHFLNKNPYYKKVSPLCRQTLSNEMTYNACVKKYKNSKNFHYPGAVWHIFLNREKKLWKNRYEVIRLMDQDGKTVSAVSF